MDAIRHYIIRGRVQGVGFRYATARKAEQLNLRGWVRNLPSGEVETVVQGEQSNAEEFESWLWVGPDYSRVTAVILKSPPDQQFTRFEILRY
ncbi:MAG: acylphosphatase [bacterium]